MPDQTLRQQIELFGVVSYRGYTIYRGLGTNSGRYYGNTAGMDWFEGDDPDNVRRQIDAAIEDAR
jgi:hypothetical protein